MDKAQVRIEYQTWGDGQKFRTWVAIENETGQAIDYHGKAYLIDDCKKNGLSYEVIRYHKDGTKSVMERG